MKAIVQDRYGDVDVLDFRDIDQPVPKDDEVLVEVRAAGLHRGDWHIMTGLPYLIRVVVPTLGLRKPKVPVLGIDVAGTVEAVGQKVTRFQPGDEVFGWCDGAFAEYASAPEDQLAAKPAPSASSRRPSCPPPGSRPSRRCATWAGSSRGSGSWSSGRQAAWGRSGCSWPRRSVPR